MSTRAFIAIELGSPLVQALSRRIQHLRRISPGIKWVDPLSLHLTLTFLGELDDAQLAAAMDAALNAATPCRPFRLALGRLGFFGPPTSPRVVWAGVTGDLGELHRLQADLTQEQIKRQLPDQDHHSFSPHLTLARLGRPPAAPKELQQLMAELTRSHSPGRPEMQVEQISVMKSQLARPHAIYTRLAAFPLLGGSARHTSGPSDAVQ